MKIKHSSERGVSIIEIRSDQDSKEFVELVDHALRMDWLWAEDKVTIIKSILDSIMEKL